MDAVDNTVIGSGCEGLQGPSLSKASHKEASRFVSSCRWRAHYPGPRLRPGCLGSRDLRKDTPDLHHRRFSVSAELTKRVTAPER